MNSRTALIAQIAAARMPADLPQIDPDAATKAAERAIQEATLVVQITEHAAREQDRPEAAGDAPAVPCPECGGTLMHRAERGRVILDDRHSIAVSGAWYCDGCPEVLVAVRHVASVDRHG